MGFWHSFDTVLTQFAPKAGQSAVVPFVEVV